MFNNLINIHDFKTLVEKARQGRLDRVFSRFFAGKKKRVRQAWDSSTGDGPKGWGDIKAVREYWNLLISGNAETDFREFIYKKHFPGKNSLLALSLGCGAGANELRWAEVGAFKRIDAYDLSEVRIELARKKAVEKGRQAVLNFQAGDVFKLDGRENYYDVVICEASLHHFSPLDSVMSKIHSFLKDDGFFIINEFVGPTRFQWTKRQMEAANAILSLLPSKYRTRWGGNLIKSKVYRPSILSMVLWDPSEAVESSDILPLLQHMFDVLEIKSYGGTILNVLFQDIAHNFLSEDEETLDLIKLCIVLETKLLKFKEVESDFVVAVCKKRGHSKAPTLL